MRWISLALLALLLLSGCSSQVPLAVNAPLSTQLKAKSTHHWDVLADDLAVQTSQMLENEPKTGGALRGKPLYVVPAPVPTTFDKAFRELLITRMVNHGMPVAAKRGGGIEVQYETQVVRHNSPRYGHVPGTATALSAGVFVVRELVEGSFAAVPGALGIAALADWGIGKYAGGATPTELIVTTSIALDNRYLFRKSSIYYIETEDAELYLDPAATGYAPGGEKGVERGVKRMEVVGK